MFIARANFRVASDQLYSGTRGGGEEVATHTSAMVGESKSQKELSVQGRRQEDANARKSLQQMRDLFKDSYSRELNS